MYFFFAESSQKEAYDEHLQWNKEVREKFHNLKENLPLKQALIVGDFKENVKIPMRLRNRNASFYQNQQVSVLTFVVFTNSDGKTRKVVVTFVSKVLNHDALCLRDCMYKLSTMKILRVCVINISFPFSFFFVPGMYLRHTLL
jgi:hypothetical protein